MQKKFLYIFAFLAITALFLTTPIQPVAASNSGGKLEITALSGTKVVFTPEEISAMTKTYVYADLFCYGNLVVTGKWGGVQLSYLLSQANLTEEVGSVRFVASDGYKVVIPIELAQQPQVIVAYERDEESLSEGYRLILPEFNGAVWIAYITSLSMLTSGAEYPDVVSAPAPNYSGNSPQLNAPTTTPRPTTPTPQPTPTTIPSNNQAEPTATPQPAQPTPTPQITNSNLNINDVLLYVIVAVSVVSVAVAALAVKRKSRKQ